MELEIGKHFIGLSPFHTAYPLTGSLTADDVTASESTFFVTELEGLHLDFLNQTGKVWEVLNEARRVAMRTALSEIVAGMATRFKSQNIAYNGYIGDTQYKGKVTDTPPAGSNWVFDMEAKYIPGVVIKVKEVGLLLDSVAFVTVSLPDGNTVQIATKANSATFVKLAQPINIQADGGHYLFSYSQGPFTPLGNTVNCGCNAELKKLYNFIEATQQTPAYGISLKVEIKCDFEELLKINIRNSKPDERAFANMIVYKTGELALRQILTNPEINRYTAQESKAYDSLAGYFSSQYASWLNWIVSSGHPLGKDFCYFCPATSSGGLRKLRY